MFFALDLPPGSEIMVPSYTYFATIVPMRLFGLVPVFVDINPLPCFTSEVPELLDQYVKAFEKVWAHRRELV